MINTAEPYFIFQHQKLIDWFLSFESKTNGFKNRLSKYLKDLGFEKKRYDDGYYYHGISSKMIIFNKPIEQTDIDNYIKERKSPLELLHEKRIEWEEKEGK